MNMGNGQALQTLEGDALVISSWLHGHSPETMRAYHRDIARFLAHAGKGLREMTLLDLQGFAGSLADLAPTSRKRILAAVKSLLTFAQKTGYLPFNVGTALKLPKAKDTLAERILPESAVQRILALEENPRNHALLRLMYGAGLRRAEVAALCWRDLQESQTRDGRPTGQVVVFGKGGKTRVILLSPETWAEVIGLRQGAPSDAPIFLSRENHVLSLAQLNYIVAHAAARAGIDAAVSPHWLRHAHASHALDRGAPISLVQQTLGHASIQTTGRYLHARPNDSSAQYLPV